MVLPMNILVASDAAKNRFMLLKRRIVSNACSSCFVPRLVGVSQALEWANFSRVLLGSGSPARWVEEITARRRRWT